MAASITAVCSRSDVASNAPEGTRRAAAADADEPAALRVGGLKNLYEAQCAVLIVISVNKASGVARASKGLSVECSP